MRTARLGPKRNAEKQRIAGFRAPGLMQFCVACQEIWRSVNLVDPNHGLSTVCNHQELRATHRRFYGYRIKAGPGQGLTCDFLPRINDQRLGIKPRVSVVR